MNFHFWDVSKLPPVAPEAAGSMVSLFEIMSSQRRDIDALSKAVADLTADVEKNKSEISSAKPPMQARKTYSAAVYPDNLSVMTAPSTSSYIVSSGGENATQMDVPPLVRPRMAGPAVDADGFQTIGRKKKTVSRQSGAAAGSNILKAGPEKFDVVITNVNPSLTCDDIKTYVTSQEGNIIPDDVKDTSTEGWSTKRFLITFDTTHMEKVLQPTFWPDKIYFRRWFKERPTASAPRGNNTTATK